MCFRHGPAFSGCPEEAYGFRGSLGSSAPPRLLNDETSGDAGSPTSKCCIYDSAHLSQTYVALCSLLILRDDLSRVDRKAVLEGVRQCQLSDGRLDFFTFLISHNCDMLRLIKLLNSKSE